MDDYSVCCILVVRLFTGMASLMPITKHNTVKNLLKLILIISLVWLYQSSYIYGETMNNTKFISSTDFYEYDSIQNPSKSISNQKICKQLKEAKNEIEVEFKQLEHDILRDIFYSGMKKGQIHKNQLKQFINKCN